MGKKHQPHYRLIAIDSRKSLSSGEYLDNLGYYNPMVKPAEFKNVQTISCCGNRYGRYGKGFDYDHQ
jgi:ribosomal protein S16